MSVFINNISERPVLFCDYCGHFGEKHGKVFLTKKFNITYFTNEPLDHNGRIPCIKTLVGLIPLCGRCRS